MLVPAVIVAVLAAPAVGEMFGWVFFAAIVCLAVALGCMLVMRERPLRGATPAPAERPAGGL